MSVGGKTKIRLFYTPDKIEYALSQIKKYELMYSFGGISTLFFKSRMIYCVALLYKNGKPIACGITTQHGAMFDTYNIAAYVDQKYRKNGYGKQIVEAVYLKTIEIVPDYKIRSSNHNFYEPIICKIK